MSRPKREKVDPRKEGYYHAFNRSVFELKVFKNQEEKDRFFNILDTLLNAFFVTLIGVKLQINHFHLIFKIQIPENLTDEELEKRFKILYPNRKYNPLLKGKLIERLGDLSQFMKALQERFAKQYNKDHERYGHVWAGRFGSNILADEEAL